MLKKLHGRKLAVCLIGGAMYALFSAFGWQAEHGGVIWAGAHCWSRRCSSGRLRRCSPCCWSAAIRAR